VENYLLAGDRIVERLRDQLPGIPVLSNLGQISEKGPPQPTVVVLLESDRPRDIVDLGRQHLVEQVWQTIIAASVLTGGLEPAGMLAGQVLNALSGWRIPDPGFVPLKRVLPGRDYSRPAMTPNGVMYLPIAFEVRFRWGG
jgi:hypothetical protein